MYACTYVCMCVYVGMYVCMYVYVGRYVCMHVCTYVCMHVCMHTRTPHMHALTYMYVRIPNQHLLCTIKGYSCQQEQIT